MIPRYSRVAAIDDNEEHLKAITWGLSLAGFCPVPFLFEDGELASPPLEPVSGIRIVFTDIHMIGGSQANHKIHSGIIIKCLKKIAATGPYALIFWSMFPSDVEQLKKLIESDGPGAGLTAPIGYGAIDKGKILGAGGTGPFEAQVLRDLIIEQLGSFPTLATAAHWEMRAAEAAAKTTDAVFSLTQVQAGDARTKEWESMLSFLASEAVGKTTAAKNVTAALDSALLPILEDQLSFIGRASPAQVADTHPLLVALSGSRPKRPKQISVARLNASYLIDEAGAASPKGEFERGMVIQLPGSFVNSGQFMRHFGREKSELLHKEFLCGTATPEQISALPLHVVELGPECDHVQSKVSTHRFLLALLVPVDLTSLCMRSSGGHHNDSVIDAGRIAFKSAPADEFHLLISTRCFMALAPGVSVGGLCKFRLRRMSIEEVVHRYTSHMRRPGVMRFNA